MEIGQMLNELIRMGYIIPRSGEGSASSFGSYKVVPSITLWGDTQALAVPPEFANAKLEQYSSGN